MRYLANTYFYSKNHKKSFEKFGALEKIDTLKAEEYARWARVSLGVPDSSSAITLFKKAIEVNPELDVYSELALIFQKQKRNKEAAEFYFKKAERDTTPNKTKYYMAAGQFYYSEKELDKAIDCFDKSISSGTSDLKVHFYKAQAYKQYPKNDSVRLANENYRKFLEVAEKNPEDIKENIKFALIDLGEYEYKVTKNYQKAISYFDELLKFDSRSIVALMYRAICYAALNQKEEACKTLDKLLLIAPNNKDAADMKKNFQCWMFK
jgi:tetratricopeptide (TPR) repeat protein